MKLSLRPDMTQGMSLRVALFPFGFVFALATAFLAVEQISASVDRHFGYSVSALTLAP